MKVIFIAGSYRDKRGSWFITENILKAKRVAEDVWQCGAVAICPHLNSMLMDGMCDENTWLAGYQEVLKRCDAVMIVANYKLSEGTSMEIDLAQSLGIPVFYKIWQLVEFLEEK